eukprot:g11307.t1 g11307   contig5:571233-571817(+)
MGFSLPDFLNYDGDGTNANNNDNSLLGNNDNAVDNEFGNYDISSISFAGGSDVPNLGGHAFNNIGLGGGYNSDNSANSSINGSNTLDRVPNATPQLVYQSSHTEIYRLGPSIGIKVLVGASETDTPIDALGTVSTSQLGGGDNANVGALSPPPLNSLIPSPGQQQPQAKDQLIRLLHEQNISKFYPFYKKTSCI